jgi:hypothetical protein
MPPVQRLDDLLGGQRDQHADDDDPHLANERAPAVQRFGEMEMHAAHLALQRSAEPVHVHANRQSGGVCLDPELVEPDEQRAAI